MVRSASRLASSWNILGGLAGQVSLGYSAFIGIGAYTTALLSLKGVDPYATLPHESVTLAKFSVAPKRLPTPRTSLPDHVLPWSGLHGMPHHCGLLGVVP